tara:strand:- start:154 stop:657 length:504 start_codon:yes stop_codon:yes gene_type:complete
MSFISGTNLQVESNFKIVPSTGGIDITYLQNTATGAISFNHQQAENEGSGIACLMGNGSVTQYNVVYWTSGGVTSWLNADKDTSAAATGLLAYAVGTNPDADGMMLQGFVYQEDHGFNIGQPLFLKDNGQMNNTAPTATGDYVRIMGYATTQDVLYFNPDSTWVLIG